MEVIPLFLWSVLPEIDRINQPVRRCCGNSHQASKVGHEQAARTGHGQCVSPTQLLNPGCLKVGSDEIKEGENVPLLEGQEPVSDDNKSNVNMLNVSVFSM